LARPYFKKSPYQKKPITKRAGGVTQGIGPEFKPQQKQKILKKENTDKQNNIDINSLQPYNLEGTLMGTLPSLLFLKY
jgi:hypothetical protein